MDEIKTKYSSKQEINKDETNENNNSILEKIQQWDFCRCLFKCFSFIINKILNFKAHCSILNQFFLFLLPLSHLICLGLILIHLYIFDGIFKFDYYYVIKEEFLRYLITDIDDVHFELSRNEINSQFEEIGNIMFFNIYYGELISLGILDEEKIFPNISNISKDFYYFLDQVLLIEKAINIFSIQPDLAQKHIDARNDSLSELAKIYFHFYPIISYEFYSIQTFINQTYLIAYELDDDNKKIKGKELYFNFPRINDDFLENDNFHAYNNYISPKIMNIYQNYSTELINDSYYFDNWFFKKDFTFRQSASDNNDYRMDFFHLNSNHEGNINKSNVLVLDSLYKNNLGKKFIVHIIYFIEQKKLQIGPFDHSVFIITNMTELFDNEKYSDNLTFVASQNDITEISLSSIVEEYFHYGMISNNNNFYDKGVFYDNIDINILAEPTKYYYTIKGFNIDIRYFSSFYLFTKLSQRSSHFKNYSEQENVYTYYFNESWHIKDICSKYNFTIYKSYLDSYNINCLDSKNLMYYSKKNNVHNSIAKEVSFPFCICLPLYCIKNLENNFDTNNFEYADEILLPEKCQNNLQFYENDLVEKNMVKSIEIDTSKVKLRKGENLNNQLEDQFIKFSFVKFKLMGGLSFIMISIVDNASLKNILINLINNLNKLRRMFISIISIGLSLLFVGINAFLIIKIWKISKSIYEYKLHLDNFVSKIQNMQSKNVNKQLNKKNDLNNRTNNNEFDDLSLIEKKIPQNIPLLDTDIMDNKLSDKLNDSLINEDNSLINDLFLIYCKFYRLSEENLGKNFDENRKESKNKMKIRILTENNELFKLFCLTSKYIPRFKLDINLDFNIYKDSKLMNNYLKSITKSCSNIDKEQILYTKSILYELLSTELVSDYGFITNLNFNYLTNINMDNKNKNNPIQDAIFKKVDAVEKTDSKYNETIYSDTDNPNIKLIWKYKNLIMKNIEEKFEQDDYLQLDKLESLFNTSLINAYYNYSNKIIMTKENNS